jgi:putative intracellular protease/amidase
MSLKDPNVVSQDHQKRVAIVIANPAISTTTGWPVGFWWSELTHPYFAFDEKGYEVEIFSPAGGKCEADAMSDPRDASGYSSSDLITMWARRSESDPLAARKLIHLRACSSKHAGLSSSAVGWKGCSGWTRYTSFATKS